MSDSTTVYRMWKRDGAVNAMPLAIAVASILRNCGPTTRKLGAKKIANRLMAGDVLMTPHALFGYSPELLAAAREPTPRVEEESAA